MFVCTPSCRHVHSRVCMLVACMFPLARLPPIRIWCLIDWSLTGFDRHLTHRAGRLGFLWHWVWVGS